jgi:hypothetical protein
VDMLVVPRTLIVKFLGTNQHQYPPATVDI